jgi:hypothetical protein
MYVICMHMIYVYVYTNIWSHIGGRLSMTRLENRVGNSNNGDDYRYLSTYIFMYICTYLYVRYMHEDTWFMYMHIYVQSYI